MFRRGGLFSWSVCCLQHVRVNFNDAMAQRTDAVLPRTRNLGIVAHIDAGKTTTTERMLYYAGRVSRVGEVDSGTTTTDFLEEEASRGITIQSAAVTLQWQDHKLNLIDTPGHVDFTVEVERSLRVCDGVVAVFDASAGVQAQSHTVLRQARKFNTPVIAFLNKMDKSNADFSMSVKSIRNKLSVTPLLVQMPLRGEDGAFNGVIDLVDMQAVRFTGKHGEKLDAADLSEGEKEEALQLRHTMLSELSSVDDALSEALIMALEETNGDETAAEQSVPSKVIRAAIRRRVLQQSGESYSPLVPVLCGASRRDMGVQPLMSAVNAFLPSPLDRPALTGFSATKQEVELPTPSSNCASPTLALAFKVSHVIHQKKGSKLPMVFIRVYTGRLVRGMVVRNQRTGKTATIDQVFVVHAESPVEADVLGAGQIGAIFTDVAGTGDTLYHDPLPTAKTASAAGNKKMSLTGRAVTTSGNRKKDAGNDPEERVVSLEGIDIPAPAISYAIEAETAEQLPMLEGSLRKLAHEDPSFKVTTNEHGQTIVSGMGELHIEIMMSRLEREYQMVGKLTRAIIEYREAPTSKASLENVRAISAAGAHLFSMDIEMMPQMDDDVVAAANNVDVDVAEGLHEELAEAVAGGGEGRNTTPAHLDHVVRLLSDVVKEVTQMGPLANLPVVGATFRVNNYKQMVPRLEDRHARDALRKIVSDLMRTKGAAKSFQIVEPIMNVEVHMTDDTHLGNVIRSLNEKKALSVDMLEDGRSVGAIVAMRNVTKYAMELRKAAKGNAHYFSRLDHYRLVTSKDALQRILANFGVQRK